ncbi:TPA_asm: DNA (cytosine-5-)-methyltransferase, partial [Salmonella enterica subsp. enterica serovar Enteritidis str. P125109]|nr:DNA (cytosine-5-)-methyltransferase [Salmonella enterica subsp. enterica serovar Enteritidis str. P125109]
MTYKVAGLFGGVGGIELGFEQAGFKSIWANEIDDKAAITYQLNHEHPLAVKSINDVANNEVPDHDVLVGGFPCQAFSIAGYRKGFEDERGNVFFEVV